MHSTSIFLLLLPLVASTKALILPLAAANPTLSYRVPETQTILYINYFPYIQIPREDLKTAINNIRYRMANHIKDEGDGWLLPNDDPVIETISTAESEEWDVIIQSSPVTVHLTYGVVLDVMEGWENLINGEMGPCQLFAAIQNTRRGQVGRLRVFQPHDAVGAGDLLID
ncbi:MAG: hypothetical protein Q9161_000500 [Pseudevernia consocians]